MNEIPEQIPDNEQIPDIDERIPDNIADNTRFRYTSYDQLPLTMNASQAAKVIGCSVSKMYELMHSVDFPTTFIGKRMMVRKESLIRYMDAHTRSVSFGSD